MGTRAWIQVGWVCCLGVALAVAGAALASSSYERAASPPGARLYFLSPSDGETVSGPVTVRFGLAGMGVAPSGVKRQNTGHHHLIVDAPTPAMDAPLPADAQHLHFGGGQTETTIALAPGTHTLQLVLGDENHVPHQPPLLSERITITVE
jgi:hypothetical protein